MFLENLNNYNNKLLLKKKLYTLINVFDILFSNMLFKKIMLTNLININNIIFMLSI